MFFDTLEEAEKMLSLLNDIALTTGFVYFNTFLTMKGVEERVNEDWGWTDLSKATIEPECGRYYISLPAICISGKR